MPMTYQVNKSEIESIKNEIKNVTDAKIYKRLEVIYLRANGRKNAEIAEITGFAKAYVSMFDFC